MGALIVADSPMMQEYSLLASLRKKSKDLTEQIEAVQDNIEEFNLEYYNRFSTILYQIFLLEKELGIEGAQRKIEILEEQKKDKKKLELPLQERINLKKLFREAAKRLHPDTAKHKGLSEEQSKELMQRLNEAYERQDIETVRQISETWGKGYRGETKQEILRQIEKLKEIVAEQEQKLTALKSTLDYKNFLAAKNAEWWQREDERLFGRLNSLMYTKMEGAA